MAEQEVKYTLSLRDLFTGKIKDADSAVNRFEGTLGKAKGAAMSLAGAVGIAFGTAAVVAFGSKMIQAGTTVENALTGLTTLLRDKAEAQSVINNTMEDATKTPFAFEGLLSANKALISAGVEAKGAREDVLNLANAIAATGGGDDELQRMVVNMQQIKNTGKATAMDIKQFAFAGVNIYKVLADATGKPIEKVKDMEISYDLLTMALKKAHDAGGIYHNGLENMAGNTSVRISNLGDSVFQLSVKMFNDLKPAIDKIISGIAKMVTVLSDGWNWLVRNKDIVYEVAIGVGVAAAAVGTYLLVANLGAIATGVLTAAQWLLNAAITANPIGLLIVGIAAVVAAIVHAYNHFAKFRAVLFGVWETVKEFGRIVSDVFTGLWHVIHGVFTMSPSEIKLGGAQQIDAIFNAGQRLGSAFKKGFDGGMADFAKDQKANSAINAPKDLTKKGAGKAMAGAPEMKSETKGAKGTKVMTINITIGSLIKDFQIRTTNIQEGSAKVREMVTQALIGATNDSQIIAGE